MAGSRECHRAFGISLDFEAEPPGAWEPRPARDPRLEVRASTRADIETQWSGLQEVGWPAMIDGLPFVAEVGVAGDHRFLHGEVAVHHLSADATLLRCAPSCPQDQTWWRLVLDSVLFSVALHLGSEALHAAAVASERGAIAIAATTGGGKSTLLAQLLSEGFSMLADDVVVVEERGEDAPLAHPGPPVMNAPAAIDPLPGEVIAPVGDERWVAVPTHPEPLPLGALILLNRMPDATAAMRRIEQPLALVLQALMRFPSTMERERARFELASTIATQVPIWELRADQTVTPARLAQLLRAEVLG